MGPCMYFSRSKNPASEVVGHSAQNVKWFFKNVQQMSFTHNI